VQNAMNIGVGISYDLCYTKKNGTLVKLAENKFIEAQNYINGLHKVRFKKQLKTMI
jgi:hypothetical protein